MDFSHFPSQRVVRLFPYEHETRHTEERSAPEEAILHDEKVSTKVWRTLEMNSKKSMGDCVRCCMRAIFTPQEMSMSIIIDKG